MKLCNYGTRETDHEIHKSANIWKTKSSSHSSVMCWPINSLIDDVDSWAACIVSAFWLCGYSLFYFIR